MEGILEELKNFDYLLLLRLLAALVLGGAIGWERGGNNHEAGLRTHIIVCMGAATVMIISECLVEKYQINSEIMRMSSQVISGIGFLGAGSIIIDGNRIRGITTAAGIWTTACVGIAVGAGYYVIAFALVALMLFTMFALKPLTKKLQLKSMANMLKIEISDRAFLKEILNLLIDKDVMVHSVEITNSRHPNKIYVMIELDLPPMMTMDMVVALISHFEGINQIFPVAKG